LAATIASAALLLGGLVALLVLVRPWPERLGLASQVTLGRLVLVLALGVAAVVAPAPGVWIILASLLELFLDAIDGPLARRRGEASPGGARLDGETDALFVLVLSVLAWRRPDGPGVVVRGKIICNSAIVALLLCLLPVPGVPAVFRTGLCAAIVLALVYSFSFDVRYLLARSRA
jgi:phosphatidylglycerophosphate synthase